MAGRDEDTRYWVKLSIRESVVNALQHDNQLDDVSYNTLPEGGMVL